MCLSLKNAFYPKPLSHLWLNWTKSEKNRNWFGIADHGLVNTVDLNFLGLNMTYPLVCKYLSSSSYCSLVSNLAN